MSAYASLPGSLLPFFAFGSLSSSPPKEGPKTNNQKDDEGGHSAPMPKQEQEDTATSSSTTRRNTSLTSGICSLPNIFNEMSPLETDNFISQRFTNFVMPATANAADPESNSRASQPPPSSSSRPSDIIIAISSARVDPVALIKSLTSRGSSIARRTACFIARTPSTVVSAGESKTEHYTTTTTENVTDEDSSNNKKTTGEEVGDEGSFFSSSRPGLCYDDTDSDEEYSMYDYSDDFSSQDTATTNNDDDDEMNSSTFRNDEQLAGGSNGDPSAIEFQLSITFQGRKYNATRAFPTFVKLREDLLHEIKGNDHRRSKRHGSMSMSKSLGELSDDDSVPELPRVSTESLSGQGGYALSGVARSGFALLQATAQHYCPEMEGWMRQVVEAFPCSQSLSKFLWEPLSSSSVVGFESKDSTNYYDKTTEQISPLTAFAKPPLHHTRNNKPKSSGNSSKAPRFKTVGSVGSLDSIQEGDSNDCGDDIGEDW